MAQNGNTVIVTNHGAPVARLTPIDEPAGDSIGQMIADGELLPPDDQGSFLDLPIAHASPDAPSGQAILDEIREDRL